jgi:hypothetical protein
MERMAMAINSSSALPSTVGTYLPWSSIPGSRARNLDAAIEQLRSAVGLRHLQTLREAAGGASGLGQLTEREMAILQNSIANLDTSQSPEAFQRQLQQIIAYARGARQRIIAAYEEQYGPWAPPGGGAGRTPRAEENDPLGIR